MIILNLAAGKIKPIPTDDKTTPNLTINLDTAYYSYMEPELLEDTIDLVKQQGHSKDFEYFCNEDAFTFMERTKIMFDRVCIYRFLEHVPFEKVPYFIYLLSTITDPGATIDIIVPDYTKLAQMILDESPNYGNFEANNILLTTELLNEPSCPHASIWTVERAKHFFELEGRFRIEGRRTDYPFDGRDIYLRFFAIRDNDTE